MRRERLAEWHGAVDYIRRYQTDLPPNQYELPGITREFHPSGPPVEVPPLWHAVVTARLEVPPDQRGALRAARRHLEEALRVVESVYPLGPQGLFVQVAYGLPYFRRTIPASLLEEHMPHSFLPGTEGQWAVIDSIRFPKDPPELVLEGHDLAFHFLSDFQPHLEDTIGALFGAGSTLNGIPVQGVSLRDLLTVTSIRRGFAGKNMPRLMGQRVGLAGAEHIPEGSMLFMGFTSTGTDSVATGNAPSFETVPGFTDLTPQSYFAHGTAMHLSRTAIDLAGWYSLPPQERLHRMFHPRHQGEPGALTHQSVPLPLPPGRLFTLDPHEFMDRLMEHDAAQHGVVGHGMQLHGHDRTFRPVRTAHGDMLPPGAVYFLRQDFNTVENPFSYSLTDTIRPEPSAGLHFVGFGPSSQQYEQMRLQMDSVDLQRTHDLPDHAVAISRFLTTTHRQNFLLPPRSHRSLPLVELL